MPDQQLTEAEKQARREFILAGLRLQAARREAEAARIRGQLHDIELSMADARKGTAARQGDDNAV